MSSLGGITVKVDLDTSNVDRAIKRLRQQYEDLQERLSELDAPNLFRRERIGQYTITRLHIFGFRLRHERIGDVSKWAFHCPRPIQAIRAAIRRN